MRGGETDLIPYDELFDAQNCNKGKADVVSWVLDARLAGQNLRAMNLDLWAETKIDAR